MEIFFGIMIIYNAIAGVATYNISDGYRGPCNIMESVGEIYDGSPSAGVLAATFVTPAYPGMRIGCELGKDGD